MTNRSASISEERSLFLVFANRGCEVAIANEGYHDVHIDLTAHKSKKNV